MSHQNHYFFTVFFFNDTATTEIYPLSLHAALPIFAHAQVIEYQTHVTRESSHFLRHPSSAFGFEHADGETAKPGDVFRAMAGTDATAVLIIVPIDHVVATLDHPMPPVDLEHALRAGFFPRAAGEAVRNFQRALAALFVRAVPLDDERLAHMRKIEITVQFRGRPDLAGFDASVVWRGVLDKIDRKSVV